MARCRASCPVLVVDDDFTIREALTLLLQDEGYPVEQASNGIEALASLVRQRPRVVLLDMRMPVMDGWAFAAELAKRGIDIPLVAMTATSDARAWAEEIGAAGYLGKPFEADELFSLLDRLCAA